MNQFVNQKGENPTTTPSATGPGSLDEAFLKQHLNPTTTPSATGPGSLDEAFLATNLKPTNQPSAPPKDMEWKNVGFSAIEHAPESAWKAVVGMVQPFLHPIDTAEALGALGKGIVSKTGYFLPQDAESKAKNEAVINALGADYYKTYGSLEGFKEALATDPFRVFTDLGTIASGGGLALGKAGSLLGKVSQVGTIANIASGLEKTGSVLGKVGDVTNPVAWAAKGASLAGRTLDPLARVIGSKIAGSTPYWDNLGFTDKTLKLIDKTFQGRLTPQQLNDIGPDIAAVLMRKGATPEALKEAVMSASGMTPTKSAVSGIRPNPMASESVESVGKSNLDLAQEKMAGLRNASAPLSSTALADALEEFSILSKNYVKKLGDAIDNEPGQFHPSLSNTIVPEIGISLQKWNIPDLTKGKSAASAALYPETIKAIDMIKRDFIGGNMPFGQELTLKNMYSIDKAINSFWKAASGEDARGLEALKEAWSNNMQSALQATKEGTSNLFKGGNPDSAMNAIGDFKDAFKQDKNQFASTKNTSSSTISKAVKALNESPVYDSNGLVTKSASNAAIEAAQGILSAGLKNPKSATGIYDKLVGSKSTPGIFPAGSDKSEILRNMIRASVAEVGDAKSMIKSIDNFLSPKGNKGLADRVFSSSEQSELARLSESLKIITNPLTKQSEISTLTSKIYNSIQSLGLGGTGFFGAGMLFPESGLFGQALATVAGSKFSNVLDKFAKRKEIKRELFGAPLSFGQRPVSNVLRPTIQGLGTVGDVTKPLEVLVDQYHGSEDQNSQVTRATGGRVSHVAMADKLILAAERAKKALSNTTEPLLNAPDESIAKALAVANRHI
jgi:hypothetical protein